MSAQIIAALRRRAKVLDQKAALAESLGGIAATIHAPFFTLLAIELRDLADDAEGHEPQQGPPFPGAAEPQTGVEQP